MKINELNLFGPKWAQGNKQRSGAEEEVLNSVYNDWNSQARMLANGGVNLKDAATLQQEIGKWAMSKYSLGANTPQAQQALQKVDPTKPQTSLDYVKVVHSMALARYQAGERPGQQPQQGQQNQQPGNQNAQQGQQPADPNAQQQQPADANAQQQQQPAEPEKPKKASAEEFASDFENYWNEFKDAGGSIGAPAVKSLVKDMWMQTGGTATNESVSHAKIRQLFYMLNGMMLREGVWDSVKGAAKASADKLRGAWQGAGQPDKTGQLADLLVKQGIDPAVLKQAFATLNIPYPEQPADANAQQAQQAPQGQAQAQPVAAPTNTWKYKVPGSDSVYDVGTDQSGQLLINMDGEWETVDDEADKKAIMDPANKVQGDATAPAQQTAQPAQKPSTDVATFVQNLKSKWDNFINNNGSIGAPRIKQLVHNMWMQTGGTKATESRK